MKPSVFILVSVAVASGALCIACIKWSIDAWLADRPDPGEFVEMPRHFRPKSKGDAVGYRVQLPSGYYGTVDELQDVLVWMNRRDDRPASEVVVPPGTRFYVQRRDIPKITFE
jgi:hypothetical protein